MEFTPIELFGYLGSIMVAVSLSLKDIVWLRIVNMIGALIFTIYGIVIGSYPIVLLNAYLVVVNAYHLFNIKKS